MEQFDRLIVCVPMFNSYGLVDRILTGSGKTTRQFITVRDLADALTCCGVPSAQLAKHLQDLEGGCMVEIRITQPQLEHFYSQGNA